MIEKAKILLAHAVEQFGKADREYKLRFGASSPHVEVANDDGWNPKDRIASLWMVDDEIKVKKYS